MHIIYEIIALWIIVGLIVATVFGYTSNTGRNGNSTASTGKCLDDHHRHLR